MLEAKRNAEETVRGSKSRPRTVLFLLGQKLVDFDAYLPVAMALKEQRPDWQIRFLTFSRENFEFLRQNTTLMAGLQTCGTLHCTDNQNRSGFIFRQMNRLRVHMMIAGWLLRFSRPLLLNSLPFCRLNLLIWFLITKFNGGKCFVMVKHRVVESFILPGHRERIEPELQARQSGLGRLMFQRYDALLHFHDQQAHTLRLYGLDDSGSGLPVVSLGLQTLSSAWRQLIREQAEVERRKLSEQGFDMSGEVYSFMLSKSFKSRDMRAPDSVEYAFRVPLITLRELKPEAIILIRPHPAAVDDPFLVDTLKELNDPGIVVTLAHPEVMVSLSRRTFFHVPNTVMATSYEARIIDCSEYPDSFLNERDGIPPAHGFGGIHVDPRSEDFRKRFSQAIEDDEAYAVGDVDAVRRQLIERNPPNLAALLQFIEDSSGKKHNTRPRGGLPH